MNPQPADIYYVISSSRKPDACCFDRYYVYGGLDRWVNIIEQGTRFKTIEAARSFVRDVKSPDDEHLKPHIIRVSVFQRLELEDVV